MTSRGRVAYAHARIRACRSRLLTREDAGPLLTATDADSVRRAVSALALDDPFAQLLRVYATALHGYTHAQPLFRALLGLHEIENVKLLWRGVSRRRIPQIRGLWIDLGGLATFPYFAPPTLGDVVEALAHTPYGSIVAIAARVHATDAVAAELAFDRWASQRLLDQARRLPQAESITRRLLELVVLERDAQLAMRGRKAYGLDSISGEARDIGVLRATRLRLCRRSFAGSPFLLAPAVSVVLLAEEEVRAVRALVEREGDERLDRVLFGALAGSQLGG